MKTSPRKQFFTLIEIMVVIVIAAIMFGIGIPAFSTMIQGNTMTQAIRMTTAKIKAARAYAVVNKCKVALLLPEKLANTKMNSQSWSAYRVGVVDDSNAFVSWIDGENWQSLPLGVIRAGDKKEPDKGNPNSLTNGNTVTNVPFDNPDNTPITKEIPAIIFTKNGKIEPTNPPSIGLWYARVVIVKEDNEEDNAYLTVWTKPREDDRASITRIEINPYSVKTTIKDPDIN